MMDQFLSRPARNDRLFERIQDKLLVLCCRCFPADPISEGINDKGHVDEASPGGHKREVGHPKLVWHAGAELAINLVQWTLISRLTVGGFDLLTSPNALNTKLRTTPPPPLARSLRCWAAAPFCLRRRVLS